MVQPKTTKIERRKGQGSHAQSIVALHAAVYHGYRSWTAFHWLQDIKLVLMELAWDKLVDRGEGNVLRVPGSGQAVQQLLLFTCRPGREVH